jgi:hypothetical protein
MVSRDIYGRPALIIEAISSGYARPLELSGVSFVDAISAEITQLIVTFIAMFVSPATLTYALNSWLKVGIV